MKTRLNYCWRIFGTGVAFSFFGLGSLLLSLFFLVVVRFLPIKDVTKHKWVLSSIRNLSLVFINSMAMIGLADYQFRNEALLKTRGKVIIANHPSLVDAIFLTARTENLCCIVKEDLWRNPFTSYIVKLAGYIPNHSDTVMEDASTALRSGKNVLVFPEGTRNTHDEQLNFKRGATHIALFADCEILPVVLQVTPRTLQKGDRWYDVPPRKFSVIITVHEALSKLQSGVDPDRPVTVQARQWNRFLVEFYRDRIRECVSDSQLDPILSGSYEGQTG